MASSDTNKNREALASVNHGAIRPEMGSVETVRASLRRCHERQTAFETQTDKKLSVYAKLDERIRKLEDPERHLDDSHGPQRQDQVAGQQVAGSDAVQTALINDLAARIARLEKETKSHRTELDDNVRRLEATEAAQAKRATIENLNAVQHSLDIAQNSSMTDIADISQRLDSEALSCKAATTMAQQAIAGLSDCHKEYYELKKRIYLPEQTSMGAIEQRMQDFDARMEAFDTRLQPYEEYQYKAKEAVRTLSGLHEQLRAAKKDRLPSSTKEPAAGNTPIAQSLQESVVEVDQHAEPLVPDRPPTVSLAEELSIRLDGGEELGLHSASKLLDTLSSIVASHTASSFVSAPTASIRISGPAVDLPSMEDAVDNAVDESEPSRKRCRSLSASAAPLLQKTKTDMQTGDEAGAPMKLRHGRNTSIVGVTREENDVPTEHNAKSSNKPHRRRSTAVAGASRNKTDSPPRQEAKPSSQPHCGTDRTVVNALKEKVGLPAQQEVVPFTKLLRSKDTTAASASKEKSVLPPWREAASSSQSHRGRKGAAVRASKAKPVLPSQGLLGPLIKQKTKLAVTVVSPITKKHDVPAKKSIKPPKKRPLSRNGAIANPTEDDIDVPEEEGAGRVFSPLHLFQSGKLRPVTTRNSLPQLGKAKPDDQEAYHDYDVSPPPEASRRSVRRPKPTKRKNDLGEVMKDDARTRKRARPNCG